MKYYRVSMSKLIKILIIFSLGFGFRLIVAEIPEAEWNYQYMNAVDKGIPWHEDTGKCKAGSCRFEYAEENRRFKYLDIFAMKLGLESCSRIHVKECPFRFLVHPRLLEKYDE